MKMNEVFEKQSKVAKLEIKKLIEVMDIDNFGKLSILVLENWHGSRSKLEEIQSTIQNCPKYFMLAMRAFVEGTDDENYSNIFGDITFDDHIDYGVDD